MKKAMYAVLLVLGLSFMTGCETVKGAASGASCGFHKDMQNSTASAQGAWAALEHADTWMQENLW